MSLHFDIKELTETIKQDQLRKQAAFSTLEGLGFTWEGGEQWKPPLGKAPYYLRDTPKYVTADLSGDNWDILNDRLTHNKDYKILNVDKDLYLVKDDNGKEDWYNLSWFYSEDNVSVEGIEESFDDLVYVEPEDHLWDIESSDYITLVLSNLSKEQLSFIIKVIDTNDQDYNGEDYLTMDICDKSWFWDDGDIEGDSIISFNDLFKHKDEI